MKKLTDYISQLDQQDPCIGDSVGIETSFEDLIETYIIDVLEDGVVVESDQKMIHNFLHRFGNLSLPKNHHIRQEIVW